MGYQRYIAFDVETPNHANDRMSAIGVAVVERGMVVETYDALVDPEEKIFEMFHIVKHIDDQTVKIDKLLEMAFRNSFPITPVVTGQCRPDGTYRLCTRREMGGARWLVRWAVEDQVFFRLVDFRETPHPRLE